MSDKTFGQIYGDAVEEQKQHPDQKTWGDRHAAGIAAVARHVFTTMMAERDAATRDIGKAMEAHKPVDPPQPKAGDWAMEEAKRQYNDASCWEGTPSGEARGYREAAERHYGPMVDALKEAATTAIQERDAARAECERLRKLPLMTKAHELAERIMNHVSGNTLRGCSDADMTATVERMLVDTLPQTPATPPTPQAATGDDEPKFYWMKRAEAAEAAIAELRAACEWITCSGCSPLKGQDGRWRSMFLPYDGIEAATLADAILAAYRNHKAASVAAEGTVKS